VREKRERKRDSVTFVEAISMTLAARVFVVIFLPKLRYTYTKLRVTMRTVKIVSHVIIDV